MIWAKYAAALGGIAMLYAIYWGIDDNGYERGVSEVRAEWADERSRIAEELRVAAETNQTTIRNLEAVKNENDKTIDKLRGDIAGLRVRVPQTACPGRDATGGGADAVTSSGKQPETAQDAFDEFRRGLESDAEETDKLIESCRVVIDWAKGIGKK